MNSLLKKTWKIKTPFSNKPLIDRICQHRDLDLKKELTAFHSPWKLKDIEKAVKRIQKAITDGEKMMIFGDYDVDGVSGASILYLGLKELGGKVSVRLPHRERDGYGLNTKVLDECKALGVNVVITVDCGISNVKEVEYGNQLGLDIIITDHHVIPPVLPEAYAILNPKQVDCDYPDKNICGTVVGLKLIEALFQRANNHQSSINDYLDLAALATVADCIPLQGENRLIVKKGLVQMKQTRHRGLRSLLESYQLTEKDKHLTSYHLGFNIAPCINAAGRLEDPLIAFKMLMGDEEKALELRSINQERQEIVLSAFEELRTQVEEKHMNDPILILWEDHWQPGITGLLAGKLCERYYKPSICLTKLEEKYVGSCRSIPQINIVEQLQQFEDLFLNYGGHAQAAGLSIMPKNLEIFKEELTAHIGKFVKKNPIEAILSIDTEMSPEEISLESSMQLSQLEPFGMGNPKPKFLLKNTKVLSTRAVGKDKTHLQMNFLLGDTSYKGIAFQMAEHEQQIQKWKELDIVCQLNPNEFRGKMSIDLQLIDARKSF